MQIQIRLQRNRNGISVNVQTSPLVEQMFQVASEGKDSVDTALFGRYWSGSNPLLAYALNPNKIPLTGTLQGSGIQWTLDDLGGTLFNEGSRGGLLRVGGGTIGRTVNLSMLRLKGTSEPGGVTFRYHDIMSEDYMKELTNHLHQCSAAFYGSFLRDVDITLRINKED